MRIQIALIISSLLLGTTLSSRYSRYNNNNPLRKYNHGVRNNRRITGKLWNESSPKREEDFYSYFIREAPKYPADYDADYSPKSIPWFDEKKFFEGQKFYDRNFIGTTLATLYSGIELCVMKSTTSVLMIAGTVSSKKNAYKRVLQTVTHTLALSSSSSGMDMFKEGTPAHHSVETIRRKHRAASHFATNRSEAAVEFIDQHLIEPVETLEEMKKLIIALRADLAFVDTSEAPRHLFHWDANTPVGQFDLAVVQFIIFSHVAMTPKAYGIYLATPEDIQSYVHNAAVVGRALGIEDRFNVALNLPPSMYKTFYRNIVVANLKFVEEPVLHVMSVSMQAMSDNFILPDFLKLKCWLHYSLLHSVDGYKGKHILKLMNFHDHTCLTLLEFGTGPINYSRFYGNFGKDVFRVWFAEQKAKFNITV